MLHNMPSHTQLVDRGEGRIAVDVAGAGPLVLCIPGIGDLRASFRHLAPALSDAGYRVAVMDLRGHGDSDVGFDAYDDAATAADALAVIDALGGGPAIVVGNSMGAAAAVIAASQRPEAIDRLVLVGPFLRDGKTIGRLAFRLALLKPWGPRVWRGYFAKLFPTGQPADLAEHRAAVDAALARPGRWRAFQRTAAGSHALAASVLPDVRAQTLIVMGGKDPDWKDPSAEAAWAAKALGGSCVVIPDVGHYPQAERPEVVLDAMLPFLHEARAHG